MSTTEPGLSGIAKHHLAIARAELRKAQDAGCVHGPQRCRDCGQSDDAEEPGGEVGTGAGEGAPRQDTGSAWVTRSEDCPEAPAQAHLPAYLTTESEESA